MSGLPKTEPLYRTDSTDFDGLLATAMRRVPWFAEAACGDTNPDGSLVHDPEIFHPEKGGSVEPAKAVCADCLVRDECREWALESNETRGVWGGMSATERRVERKRRQAGGRVLRCDAGKHEVTVETLGVSADDRERCKVCDRERAAEYHARRKRANRGDSDE